MTNGTMAFSVTVAVAFVLAAVLAPRPVDAQMLTGPALGGALQKGGYVLVVRHARSPQQAPDAGVAERDNVDRERQLDAVGRADAAAIGKTMRALGIPIAEVLTSPTYRARQTVRVAGWPNARVVPELGDRGHSMQGVTEEDGAWLRARAAQSPAGGNAVIVTHLPNITRAFPQHAAGVEDGDVLVFRPDGRGGAVLVGRVTPREWSGLTSR
jgi:phosphohistidine phosphatase SixA